MNENITREVFLLSLEYCGTVSIENFVIKHNNVTSIERSFDFFNFFICEQI